MLVSRLTNANNTRSAPLLPVAETRNMGLKFRPSKLNSVGLLKPSGRLSMYLRKCTFPSRPYLLDLLFVWS